LGSGSATGYANLSSGILKSNAISTSYYAEGVFSFFYDTITFSANATGTAYLDYHWDGTMSPSSGTPETSAANATFGIDVVSTYSIRIDEKHWLTDIPTECQTILNGGATQCCELKLVVIE
jgi:hypothetical protein